MNEKIVKELQEQLFEKTEELNILITELKDHLDHDLSEINRPTEYHFCNKCGKTEIIEGDMDKEKALITSNQWHLLGRLGDKYAGYGSIVDGQKVVIELCDECLASLLNNLMPYEEKEEYDEETEKFLNNEYIKTRINPFDLPIFDIEEI